MNAHLASVSDRELFNQHLLAYLTEIAESGSMILPTHRTVDFYMQLFDDYVSGAQPGVVIISSDGVSIAGHELPFDTRYGKTATGWFTYTVPESRNRGIASNLRSMLRGFLVGKGYRAIAFGVDMDNAAGKASIGSRPIHWTQAYGIEELEGRT